MVELRARRALVCAEDSCFSSMTGPLGVSFTEFPNFHRSSICVSLFVCHVNPKCTALPFSQHCFLGLSQQVFVVVVICCLFVSEPPSFAAWRSAVLKNFLLLFWWREEALCPAFSVVLDLVACSLLNPSLLILSTEDPACCSL